MSLHDLARTTDIDRMRELIATGSDVNEADKHRRTPLHLAAWSGNIEAVKLLVLTNAAIDAKAMDGFTALHFAAQSQSPKAPECIHYLVKKSKALLKQHITKGNKTALHLAVIKGIIPNINMLLSLGADLSVKTNIGQTAIDLAKTPQVRQLLLDHKAAHAHHTSSAPSSSAQSVGNDDNANLIEKVQEAEIRVAHRNQTAIAGDKQYDDQLATGNSSSAGDSNNSSAATAEVIDSCPATKALKTTVASASDNEEIVGVKRNISEIS
mmetsp:Transcript_32729/g.55183  ORF Transcript_32729/g.55183 Transcript_32729/m.55183 type:complete len:267 (-) Transcript_32729:47-847(-)